MKQYLPFRLLLALCAIVFLAACDTAEERAEAHYQEGLALLEAGDQERALVEFRNVFKLNGDHRDARATYARTVRAQGNLSGAYSQFLRLVEQYPNDLEARTALSEMAFMSNNWPEFERHSAVAVEVAPEDPKVQVIKLAGELRQAALDEDRPAVQAVTDRAAELEDSQPDNMLLMRLLIAGYIQDGRFGDALEQIDRAIEQDPENRALNDQKIALLVQLGDRSGVEDALKTLIERFPEDDTAKAELIRFYLSQDRKDDAEAFMRTYADPTATPPDFYVALIAFLTENKGAETALAELEKTIAAHPDLVFLRGLDAALRFGMGERDKAIADLELLTKDAEPSEEINSVKISLSRMLLATGNEVGARRLVEEVLENDNTFVDALKMQAAWQIEADQAEDAIFSLRQALDQNPDDVGAITLMAEAHQRAGNFELSRDFLSLAVEASNNAPAESLRFARLMISTERYRPAEDTLLAALRANPGNVQIILELGNLYIAMDDLGRAGQALDTLKRIDTPQATQAAAGLELNILRGENDVGVTLGFLKNLAERDNNFAAKIGIVRTYLMEGQNEDALRYATELLEENPENPTLKFIYYSVLAATNDFEEAARGFRELIEEDPSRETVWMQLFQVTRAMGAPEEIPALLEEALEANPESPNLLWVQASFMEQSGDIEGAIEIYEGLYERSSGSIVIANNLASLLTTFSDDPEALERGYNIARRLRGSDVPAFQDTYGWIAYRRGEYEEALRYLEPAAAGLPDDPVVRYHHAMALLALERNDEARKEFQNAVRIAGDVDTRPQIERAREELRKLQSGGSAD